MLYGKGEKDDEEISSKHGFMHAAGTADYRILQR